MAKQRKHTAPRCPDCGAVHDGMCRHEEHYISMNDPRRAVRVGEQYKRLSGFGNKRS